MGRLPDMFAGQKIRARFPYTMPGELVLAFSASGVQFADVIYTNTTVYPFEIHRMIPRVYALDNTGLLLGTQPDFSLLAALVKLDLLDFRLDMKMTKAATAIDALVKGSSERTWEWAEPYTLPNSGGFTVSNTTRAAPATFAGLGITQLLLALTFEGFQLQIKAPSDSQ